MMAQARTSSSLEFSGTNTMTSTMVHTPTKSRTKLLADDSSATSTGDFCSIGCPQRKKIPSSIMCSDPCGVDSSDSRDDDGKHTQSEYRCGPCILPANSTKNTWGGTQYKHTRTHRKERTQHTHTHAHTCALFFADQEELMLALHQTSNVTQAPCEY